MRILPDGIVGVVREQDGAVQGKTLFKGPEQEAACEHSQCNGIMMIPTRNGKDTLQSMIQSMITSRMAVAAVLIILGLTPTCAVDQSP
jgi:hypothetical protein